MAPHVEQHMEPKIENIEISFYMHKKFNCTAYTHKKFGVKFTRSRSVDSLTKAISAATTKLPTESRLEDVVEQHEEIRELREQKQQQHKHNSDIFRPYALGDNTPRKRNQQQHRSSCNQLQQMSKLYQSEGANLDLMSEEMPSKLTAHQRQQHLRQSQYVITSTSHHNFSLMLRKQNEAFYLRNMLQLNGKLAPYTIGPENAAMCNVPY